MVEALCMLSSRLVKLYHFLGTSQTHKEKGLKEFLGNIYPKFLSESAYTTFF